MANLKRIQTFTLAFCLLGFAHVGLPTAHAGTLEYSGSLKSLNMTGNEAPAEVLPDYELSSNRARLDLTWQIVSNLQFNTALDYQHLWYNPADLIEETQSRFNRRLDMSKTWQHGEHATSRMQIDRLNLQWRTGAMDVKLGRQALGFGRILISSPLDVIAPFAPDAIDTDVRSGVDALHTIFNYGLDGQFGAIAIFSDKKKNNSYLLTWTDNRSGLDILMLGGQLRGRKIFGAGLAGSLGTLGLKGEFSIHDGRDLYEPGGDLSSTYTLGAIEAWYRFTNGISLIAEYLYNGPGSEDPEDYPQVLASAPLQEGLTHLLGKQYLVLAPAYEVHPLATIQGLILYNLDDKSILVRPTLDISLANNLSVQCFWTWNAGRSPDVKATQLVVPRSEFGMRGDSGGLFLKWFF